MSADMMPQSFDIYSAVQTMSISGMPRLLAERSEATILGHKIILKISHRDRALAEQLYVKRLERAFSEFLGDPVEILVRIEE